MNSNSHLPHSGEETLIRQAIQGDLEACNQLILTYQDTAYNHALRVLGDPMQADDATQESFIKAFQSIHSFRGGSFRSWLLRIVTNSAYDMLRHFKRHPTQSLFPENEDGKEAESPSWIADPSALVQNVVEQKELSNDLFKLISELPVAYQTVLTLIDIDDLDYAEAANALKIPIGTVKSRLARARLQMKEKMKSVGTFTSASANTNICTAV